MFPDFVTGVRLKRFITEYLADKDRAVIIDFDKERYISLYGHINKTLASVEEIQNIFPCDYVISYVEDPVDGMFDALQYSNIRTVKEIIYKFDADGDGKQERYILIAYSGKDNVEYSAGTYSQDKFSITDKVLSGELKSEEICENTISQHLYTASIPDPDFIIRTSGECRLSNFLLWQASYAEMYFPQVMWPDFKQDEFDKALEVYAMRERRYGKL